MKINQILFAVFLVLLIPTGIKWFGGGVSYIEIDEKHLMFPGFVKDNIAHIQVTKPKIGDDGKPIIGQDGQPETERIVFTRSENEWRLSSGLYPGRLKVRSADITSRVFDVIPKILVNESSIIRSEANETELAEYKLDEKQATAIACFDASRKPIATLLVGRKSGGEAGEQATSGTYVRPPKKKIVVLSDEVIDLDTDEAVWVEKNLQDIPDADILEISVKNQHGLVHFKREAADKDWTVAQGPKDVGKLRKDQVTNLMSRAKYLTAQNFVAPQGVDHGLGQGATPSYVITIWTKDKKRHQLSIGKKLDGKNEYYAISTAAEQVLFTMAEWDVTSYDKPPKDFFDPKPGDGDRGKKKKDDPKKDPAKENDKPSTPKDDAEKKSKDDTSKDSGAKKQAPKKGGDGQ